MRAFSRLLFACALALVVGPLAATGTPASLAAVPSPAAQQSTAARPSPADAQAVSRPEIDDDVDAFMEKVLERRELNWDETYNYVFNEVESFRIRGMEIAALQSFEEEYTWYVRDGYLVRSPWKINGVEVDDDTREGAELEWIASIEAGDREARVQRDSFFDFEFEPGNYFVAGPDTFEGRDVVKIEYYPESLFADPDEADADDFDHKFDKTSLVTMLIVPEEHQIVEWRFENVGFEFLPYRWLVRMDAIEASMVMHQPIEDIWLPREIRASGRASTASFNLEVDYARVFSDYKQTGVGAGVVFGRPKR